VVPSKRAWALCLPEYACTRPNKVIVKLALMERARPATPVQCCQGLPALFDSLEPHAPFRGQPPPESPWHDSHKPLKAGQTHAAQAQFRVARVFHALVRIIVMLQGKSSHQAVFGFRVP